MIPRFPLYLFDVDGTLLDSAQDICGAIIDVLGGTACRPVTMSDLKRYVGVHLLDMFQDLLPDYTSEQYDQLIATYRSIYPARQHRMTTVFPGVREALGAIPGKKSTATTKGTPTTRAILEQFGLIEFFDHVQGTDGFPHKPAPDVLLKSLEVFGVEPEDCLFVGDSPADMEAGKLAGVRTCAVRYGYGDHAAMARFSPDYWISDLRELT